MLSAVDNNGASKSCSCTWLELTSVWNNVQQYIVVVLIIDSDGVLLLYIVSLSRREIHGYNGILSLHWRPFGVHTK